VHRQVIHLHPDAPGKPAEGDTCNGCGVCCAIETCPPARLRFLQVDGPCPALLWSEARQRYHCGMLQRPGDYIGWLPTRFEARVSALMSRWIAAGTGCDCSAEVETNASN
jgi:hypothetical protein